MNSWCFSKRRCIISVIYRIQLYNSSIWTWEIPRLFFDTIIVFITIVRCIRCINDFCIFKEHLYLLCLGIEFCCEILNNIKIHFRENLKTLIVNVNKQKDALKKYGITVDGVHYTVKFRGMVILNHGFWMMLIQWINLHTVSSTKCFDIATFFSVILDLKALYLLLVQIGKANFQLGKRGSEVQCCFICKALRVRRLSYSMWHQSLPMLFISEVHLRM